MRPNQVQKVAAALSTRFGTWAKNRRRLAQRYELEYGLIEEAENIRRVAAVFDDVAKQFRNGELDATIRRGAKK